MIQIPLIDSSFTHSPSGYITDRLCENGSWKRNFDLSEENFILLTHTHLNNIFDLKDKNIKVYAWLIEPEGIAPQAYSFIRSHHSLFYKIFTWDQSLLSLSENFIFIPYGTCWINDDDCNIYDKSKSVSMMISKKASQPGHKLRKDIFNLQRTDLDIYGRGYNSVQNKITALKDYRFHIVIENVKQDFWFTEKLIDCLQTGAIPIYWGCPSIERFFRKEGFIFFDDISELISILDNLNTGIYTDMLPYVKENFEISKQFLSPEEKIFKYIENDIN